MIDSTINNNSMGHVGFTVFEKTVLGLFIALIIAFIIISAWSYVLLTLEMIEGGGPIGYFIKAGLTLLAAI